MLKNTFIVLIGLLAGCFLSLLLIFHFSLPSLPTHNLPLFSPSLKKQVIGFLPYWLLDKAQTDYSKYITTLTYYGLSIDTDGTIIKYTSPGETEPGWYALDSGKLNPFLASAKKTNTDLSLLLFSGDKDNILSIMNDPVTHANNLTRDIVPIMHQFGFSDLNLDIEYTAQASDAARLHFTQFAQTLKNNLSKENAGTLTVDISIDDFVHKNLIDPAEIGKIADHVVVMTYDYHFTDSYVTGPVAPLTGAGTVSEYDVETVVQKALSIIPAQKILLGVPLYGYEWETLGTVPRSAVIPGTGLTASNTRAEDFINSCASCSAEQDTTAQESYIIYRDQETGTYHQIFYPNSASTQAKVDLARQTNLGGLALWALGYEGKTILEPIHAYKN